MPYTAFLNDDGSERERFGIDDATGEFVRYLNGAEVERREATDPERGNWVPGNLPSAPPSSAPDIVTLANNLAALTEAVDFLILDSLGGL